MATPFGRRHAILQGQRRHDSAIAQQLLAWPSGHGACASWSSCCLLCAFSPALPAPAAAESSSGSIASSVFCVMASSKLNPCSTCRGSAWLEHCTCRKAALALA